MYKLTIYKENHNIILKLHVDAPVTIRTKLMFANSDLNTLTRFYITDHAARPSLCVLLIEISELGLVFNK